MHFYKNGNYVVCIEDDGTKTRKCDGDKMIPLYPESIDISITQKCSVGCKYCYANCTPNGKHADVMSYRFLDTLYPYTEVAFNGNDLDHTQLIDFLKKLKYLKVFANMTVSQKQFMDNLDRIYELVEKKLIYGVGVSYTGYDYEFIKAFRRLDNGVLHVINGIVNTTDLFKLDGLQMKLLILGYKEVGRGIRYNSENSSQVFVFQNCLKVELHKILERKMFKAVAFDNLAIEQLNVKILLKEDEYNQFYMGDDGEFTFYIDMVNGTFSKSSSETKNIYPIGNKTIEEMFNIIKKGY